MKHFRHSKLFTITLLLASVFLFASCNKECAHSFSRWEVSDKATCTSDGSKIRICDDCGFTETKSIDSIGHAYTENIVKEATCGGEGTKEFICENCNDSYEETFPLPSYSANEVFEASKNSVVEITTYDKTGNELSLGTGFIYGNDCKIVTNYHVIDGAYSISITLNGADHKILQVLAYDKDKDLAVLKSTASNLTALPVCTEEHAVGKSVYAFGSSQGMTATFSQGIITHAHRDVEGVICVQHDAAISSGNSGGPLINEYGEVIGINSWTLRDSQNLNFAIATTELEKLSYSNPLSMEQFYETECDAFTKLKNYIIDEGNYSNGSYKLTLGYSYSSDYSSKYTRIASYDTEAQEIQLVFFINATDMILIKIDEIDGVYAWSYYDEYDYCMMGTLYAGTYDANTLVGYSYNNISSSAMRSTIRKLASDMINAMCACMDNDYADIGIAAEDLGFLCY